MGFLDNLENNLKSMESLEEKDPASMERARNQKEQEKQRALAVAPHAAALKKEPFAIELMTTATQLGHRARSKVQLTWIGNIARFSVRDLRLELQPGADGVEAVFFEAQQETRRQRVSLQKDSPAKLAEQWLAYLQPPLPPNGEAA